MNKQERQFIEAVWLFFKESGRSDLPWRQTHNPYNVLVSELMLQQTQVDRVIPKYQAFITQWPTLSDLAKAPLSKVLMMWQGLGYNRRAKFLLEAAKHVSIQLGGKFPESYGELQTLPGVGPYTAGAIMAFAYNTPVPLIETNVRRVFIHHFFKDQTGVTDAEILKLVKKTLPTENVRIWYAALMDYGASLKKEYGNMNVQSKHYTKQSKFEGSDRQIRGAIVRYLATHYAGLTKTELIHACVGVERNRLGKQLEALVGEGILVQKNTRYLLSD